jgi:hypothetical protein
MGSVLVVVSVGFSVKRPTATPGSSAREREAAWPAVAGGIGLLDVFFVCLSSLMFVHVSPSKIYSMFLIS